jgi:UDP-N-acetylglucosamine--N-acetylmuramyl-(pentapeptide) pyrophosphoryl-undecaprenol N-acetylglucosamine transferase
VPRPLRIIFAGGGTGGHLFPAIAIADEVKKLEPSANILFIGTKDKIEARIVPTRGYSFLPIWISGFQRSMRLSNLLFPIKVIVSMMQAKSILKEFKPHVVVGTGGYVAGPVLRAAVMRHIPTLIQEQNSYPGVTTRMLAAKVNEVHITFEQSKQYFTRKDNIHLTGNPTRDDLEKAGKDEALRYFGFDPAEKKKTVLIFGGSLGAHSINMAVQRNIERLMQDDLRIIWQTGETDLVPAKRKTSAYPGERMWLNAFIDRMEYAYAACDLVVCRAGATTIAEITRLGKPAILIPYPHAAANHQEENAKTLVSERAAERIDDRNVSEQLLPTIIAALDDRRLSEMSERSKKIGKPTAARSIAERVMALANASRLSYN